MSSRNLHTRGGGAIWVWLGPLLLVSLLSLFLLARSLGRWAENDSAVFARYIATIVTNGELVTAGQEAYPNGYAFQSLSAFLLAFTGVDVGQLQQLIYPLLAALVVLPAWAAYRELTGSTAGATLSTLLLFVQPEFLFVILRSSHEKFTRLLMFLCLYLLVVSFRLPNNPVAFAAHVSLFYLAAFAMTTSNNLLASSFFAAVALALALGWLLRVIGRTPEENPAVLRRLFYASLISVALVFLFIFYAYPPAENNLVVMRYIWERIAALFLDVENTPDNAYTQVASAWVSLPAYFALSVANWAMLGSSVLIWAAQGWRWLRHAAPPATPGERLLWLLYSAFAIQGVITVFADASGGIANNLQHRIFSSFSMIAVVLVGAAISRWRPSAPHTSRRTLTIARTICAVTLGCVAILSALKATNEPLVSNKWMFYRAEEVVALRWADAHLTNTMVWTEFDERLGAAYQTIDSASEQGNLFYGYSPRPGSRSLLVSEITRMRGVRLQRSLPVPYDAQRVYDNGTAQLFRLRPVTPFQK